MILVFTVAVALQAISLLTQPATRPGATSVGGPAGARQIQRTTAAPLQPRSDQATVSFSVDDIRNDFEYLYRTLDAAHYNLYAFTTKKVFDRNYDRLYATVRRPFSYLEAHRLFQEFAALSRIGHCRLDFPYAMYDEYARRGGTVFPLDMSFERNGDVFVRRAYAGQAALSPGDQLLSIDGEPIASVVRRLNRFSSGERQYFIQAGLEMISFPRKLWYTRGPARSYVLVVRKANGRKVRTIVPAIPASTFEAARKDIEVFDLKRDFRFVDGIPYLKPGPFYNTSRGNYFDTSAFTTLLASAFDQIRERRSTALIIDLRSNPGGESFFSDPLVAYFANKPFRFASSFHLRTSRVSKDTFSTDVPPLLKDAPAAIAREIEEQSRAVLAHADGSRFEFSIPEYPPHPDGSRFTGRVYVLINRHSYSNATTTAALIQDYAFGTLIGEETSDLPTSYASISTFTLPRTKIRVTYPRSYFVRPNGDERIRGVVPDQSVHDDVFTREDEALAAAIDIVKEHDRGARRHAALYGARQFTAEPAGHTRQAGVRLSMEKRWAERQIAVPGL